MTEPLVGFRVLAERAFGLGRDPPPVGAGGWARVGVRWERFLRMRDVHELWLAEMAGVEHPGYRLVSWAGAGRTLLVSAALHEDAVAASVRIEAGDDMPDRAWQRGPVVAGAHRGRLLGRWVTAAALYRIREDHPRIAVVAAETSGAGTADAVQTHLGFRTVRSTHVFRFHHGKTVIGQPDRRHAR